MNQLRNRVQLIGFLGKDPEIKEFGDGKKVARFTMATNSDYRNSDGEQVKETQWHNVVAWDKKATIIENHVSKGQEICIEGKLTTRSYEDKNGIKRFFTEIVLSDLVLLSKSKEVAA